MDYQNVRGGRVKLLPITAPATEVRGAQGVVYEADCDVSLAWGVPGRRWWSVRVTVMHWRRACLGALGGP